MALAAGSRIPSTVSGTVARGDDDRVVFCMDTHADRGALAYALAYALANVALAHVALAHTRTHTQAMQAKKSVLRATHLLQYDSLALVPCGGPASG